MTVKIRRTRAERDQRIAAIRIGLTVDEPLSRMEREALAEYQNRHTAAPPPPVKLSRAERDQRTAAIRIGLTVDEPLSAMERRERQKYENRHGLNPTRRSTEDEPAAGYRADGVPVGVPFAPGCAPGPGAPKTTSEIRALAKGMGPAMLEVMQEIALSPYAREAARVAAANAILDRGHGKAIQRVEVADASVFDEMTEEEFEAYLIETGQKVTSMIIERKKLKKPVAS